MNKPDIPNFSKEPQKRGDVSATALRWLVVFLGSESGEEEINSIIEKTRELVKLDVKKPDYLRLDINIIKDSGTTVRNIINTIENSINRINHNVAVVFMSTDFPSMELFEKVIHINNEKYRPFCSNPKTDYSFNTIKCERDNGNCINCVNRTCGNCEDPHGPSKNKHCCIYKLVRTLVYEDAITHELPEKLIKAVTNSHKNGNLIMDIIKTLEVYGFQPLKDNNSPQDKGYILKEHQDSVAKCEDVARERKIELERVLKCLVGNDDKENLYVMLIPGNKKLKIEKLKDIAKVETIKLTKTKILEQNYGFTVGAISPIPFIVGPLSEKAKIYFDKTVVTEGMVDISSGSLYSGIQMDIKDLKKLIGDTHGYSMEDISISYSS